MAGLEPKAFRSAAEKRESHLKMAFVLRRFSKRASDLKNPGDTKKKEPRPVHHVKFVNT